MNGPTSDPATPHPPDPRAFPPVLTAAMAAELLQVHVEYLRKMVREGRVPAHRFPGGRELRFLRDELLEWLGALPGPAAAPAASGPAAPGRAQAHPGVGPGAGTPFEAPARTHDTAASGT
jgi:excisionase family DNA binding protein